MVEFMDLGLRFSRPLTCRISVLESAIKPPELYRMQTNLL